MAAMSDFLENKYIDWYFRAQAFGVTGSTAGAATGPATLYVGLVTTVDNDAGSAKVEVSGGAYARVAITSSLANWAGTQGAGTTTASTGSSGTTSNNNAVAFPTPTAAWGQVTGFEIFDAATGGNPQYYGTLGQPKTINNGDPAPSFAAGTLTVQVDN
jgi:hypothetical protein